MPARMWSTRYLRPAPLLLPLLAAVLFTGCSDDSGPGGASPGIALTVVDVNTPLDITPDGSLVLLEDLNTFEGKVYTYDIASGALTHVTDVGDPGIDIAMGISADGRITALHGNPANAGIWS